MDSSDSPSGRSPRKELRGPRPPVLKIRKNSQKSKKPPLAPQPSHQQPQIQQQTQPRPPVPNQPPHAHRLPPIPLMIVVQYRQRQGIMEIDRVMERQNLSPGILSPGPASLPPIPPSFFSPVSADPNSVSFFHDLSPALYGNRNFIEGSFMASPSTFVSPRINYPSSQSIDLFNNFNTQNYFFDF
ncbi:F16F4.1 PROTEIN [Salix purpurea]|uniref:F16F4.1 PROTEIN n=1 Tax=Salix purpurea TaxID=77065 RepID=A0A9Q0WV87_SALPP|nr:F16F4.1 PROTEIN [Salix purpurea]